MSNDETFDSAYRDQLFDVLCRTSATLDQHGVWHCLIFGTLLGAVRDGDLIPWDHDVDLLIRVDDRAHAIAADIGNGITFWHGTSPGHRLALNPGGVALFDCGFLGLMDDGVARGEVYCPTLFNDGVLRLYDLDTEVAYWPQSSFCAWFVEERTTIPVRGVPLPIPTRAEELLSWHYGPDWRTPYRSVRDGGDARDGRTGHGDVAAPSLADQIAWCEQQGWDRSVYQNAGLPTWPRRVKGAGPADDLTRTRRTSRSAWWHTLDELVRHY